MSASILPALSLGAGGPLVGAQGLGCMGFSEFYGPTAPAEARETLQIALALGVTMFDTADLYGDGDNERFLGPFVRAHRDRVFLATKFGIVRRAGEKSWSEVRGDRAFVRQSVDANAALLEPVRDIAARRQITPAQVALAWVHQRSRVHGLTVIPIPGTRSPARLRQNVAAATLALPDSELAALEPLAARVAGARYPDMSSTATARE
ncbi:aldo/keto reductase [Planotetraspora sp. A-T 1434]|uniref:aldo/keto reductase n=1 Tax=Planotetraspora sp. A-T 1434 TaxID=2979219 RepID=UPI0021BFC6E9|nr:aldo/keto reductase [Planotetraspora sp. A-T 1434]MCT9931491.1 aldo/keto reductase [Planotetraspora sp. A-T 1434]